MNEPLARKYTHRHLIQDMKELRRDAGQPSLRAIARESARVATTFHKQSFKDAEQLSLTTLAATLNGQRKHPPRWPWLIVFVQTCREIARRSPGRHDGMTDEQAYEFWRKRLDAVHGIDDPRSTPPEGLPVLG